MDSSEFILKITRRKFTLRTYATYVILIDNDSPFDTAYKSTLVHATAIVIDAGVNTNLGKVITVDRLGLFAEFLSGLLVPL